MSRSFFVHVYIDRNYYILMISHSECWAQYYINIFHSEIKLNFKFIWWWVLFFLINNKKKIIWKFWIDNLIKIFVLKLLKKCLYLKSVFNQATTKSAFMYIWLIASHSKLPHCKERKNKGGFIVLIINDKFLCKKLRMQRSEKLMYQFSLLYT